MKHVLVATVENVPGVANRVASLFRRRNFNILSFVGAETEDPEISRITVVVDADKTSAALVEKHLYRLVPVMEVRDVTSDRTVMRDLALIKVKATTRTRTDIMQFADAYRARIVDMSPDSMILEISGDEDKINAFVDLMRPLGIKEMVRTGMVAMVRGDGGAPLYSNGRDAQGLSRDHEEPDTGLLSEAQGEE
jgi:acetolactate synthase I/III small subunit